VRYSDIALPFHRRVANHQCHHRLLHLAQVPELAFLDCHWLLYSIHHRRNSAHCATIPQQEWAVDCVLYHELVYVCLLFKKSLMFIRRAVLQTLAALLGLLWPYHG
jgi:hypothetical protein